MSVINARINNGDDNFFTNTSTILTDLATKGGTPLDASQEVTLGSLLTASRLGISSSAFSVLSRAVLTKNGASLDVEAVIDRLGNTRYSRASEVRL